MPPETDKGAMVLLADPLRTPLLKSVLRIEFPEPFGVSVRLPFVPVAIVSAPESLKLLAVRVCEALLIDRPLIVPAVAAEMTPPRERLPVLVKKLFGLKKL